jgi:hypothetical protein
MNAAAGFVATFKGDAKPGAVKAAFDHLHIREIEVLRAATESRAVAPWIREYLAKGEVR